MNAPDLSSPPAHAVAVASLPVFAISPSLSNPRKRFDDAYIAELADSIRNHGLIQPITVRPLSLEFRVHLTEEIAVSWYNVDKPAHTINALGAILKLQPETAKPISPASDAAQAPGAAAAPGEGKATKKAAKKPKSKADPAPALPTNEAAAPPNTPTLNPITDWPFPS